MAIISRGRSHLRPISAAAINLSFFTHFWGPKYWDTSNYRQFRAQLSCFTMGSHRDYVTDGVKDLLFGWFLILSLRLRPDHFKQSVDNQDSGWQDVQPVDTNDFACQKYADISLKYTICWKTRENYNASLTLWGGSDTFWPKPRPQLTTYSNLSHLRWAAQSWLARGNLADPENDRSTVYWINPSVSRTVTASFMDTPNLVILGPTIQLEWQLISPSPQHQGCILLFAES